MAIIWKAKVALLSFIPFFPWGQLLPSDEARFDPPLGGACLGLTGRYLADRVVVQEVERFSAAEKAGIASGDGILRLDGAIDFSGMDDFLGAARGLRRGETVEVGIRREDLSLTLSLVPDPAVLLDLYQLLAHLRRSRFLRSRAGFEEILEEIETSAPQALRAASRASQAYEVLNHAVGRFGVSHAAIVPPWTYKNLFAGEGAGGGHGTGLLIEKVGGQEGFFFICEVMDGSPGALAGALVGDEPLLANGVPIGGSPRLCLAGYEASRPHYTIQVDEGETIRLEVRRSAGGAPIALEVTADRPVSGVLASRASERWLERGGRRLAYVHLWNLLSRDLPRVLDRAVAAEGEFAEGLVVDLRGRGGQIAVTERVVQRLKAVRRPLVLLLDRESRSAKEVLAFKMKGSPDVVLVGERTAGAVIPALVLKLSGETMVMLPADQSRSGRLSGESDERILWGGLEGKGVDPDLPVARGGLYSAGADPILEAGLRAVLEKLASIPRRRRL